jgi:RNA polymerase sigma-70 factor (ECF subfamily)
MDGQSTRSLIEKASRGDRGAFETLSKAFRSRLEALVETRLGSRLRPLADVEDVVQETFLRAIKSANRYEGDDSESFFRWLGGIANHVILEAARRGKRDLIVPLDADVPAGDTSVELRSIRGERFDRLQHALDALSPDYRQVILLARVRRLPMKEVARVLHRSPEAATQLLWRALRKLKETFGTTGSFHLPPRSLDGRENDEPKDSHDEPRSQ